MSDFPLQGSFGAFDADDVEMSSAMPGFPPVPGAGPEMGAAMPMMMAAMASQMPSREPPTAVAVRHSMSGPPPMAYAGMAMPAPQQPAVGATPDLAVNDGAHSLGMSILLVGLGIGAGTYYGGIWGGISGGLYGGALTNFVRAGRNLTHGTPDSDREALISGTYGVLTAAAASYLLWKYGSKKEREA